MKPRLQPYPKLGTITLSNGEIYTVNTGGNFVRIKEADQSFTLRFDDGSEMTVSQNIIIKLQPDDQFKKLEVINDSGASLTVQLEIGFGDVQSNTVTVGGTLAAEIQAHDTLVSAADDSIAANTTEQVLAANTDRKEALISNLASNTDPIRIDDSNTDATQGIEVLPGSTVTLQTKSAIFVHNTKGSAQSVGILEIE